MSTPSVPVGRTHSTPVFLGKEDANAESAGGPNVDTFSFVEDGTTVDK